MFLEIVSMEIKLTTRAFLFCACSVVSFFSGYSYAQNDTLNICYSNNEETQIFQK